MNDELEIIPVTSPTPVVVNKKEQTSNDFQDQIQIMIQKVGTIALTEQQKEILYKPVNVEDVEIRSDGLIYLPWMEYVSRLKDSFGMEWSIVPHGMPKVQENMVIWGFYLIIRGAMAGYAIGEQAYWASNQTMSWSDACEGAKSNALMRLCKGIGIGLELWKPSFIRDWKKAYAQSYEGVDKRGQPKTLWRKKGSEEPPRNPAATTFEKAPKEIYLETIAKAKQHNIDLSGILKSLKIENRNPKISELGAVVDAVELAIKEAANG